MIVLRFCFKYLVHMARHAHSVTHTSELGVSYYKLRRQGGGVQEPRSQLRPLQTGIHFYLT